MTDLTVHVDILTSSALADALSALADLRIAVFREWPYLYDGSRDYEARYVEKFAKADGAVIVAARDGERIVGAATAAPLSTQDDAFQAPFLASGMDVAPIFYFAESVLLPAYRGQGLGHRFFDAREAHARALGRFTHATFCAVVRPGDHPLCPSDARGHDSFWTKRGYAPVDGLVGAYAWTDVGADEETEKPMQFWMGALG